MTDGNIMKIDPAENQTIKIVEEKFEGDKLLVTVEGPDVEAVTNAAARQLAYKARLKKGMHNAGLEAYGGPYPYDRANQKDLNTQEDIQDAAARQGDLVYRCQYRLTPGI
jgi:hypothetical protein